MTHNATAHLSNMLRSYTGPQHRVVGLALSNEQTEYICAGVQQTAADAENLIFEIGSITKIFTAILLCVLVEEGRIDPKAPLHDLSEKLSAVPAWITPEKLTSHTSGLPRLHVPTWKTLIKPLPEDPYAQFTRQDLMAWLQIWSRSAKQPKQDYVYSNLGVGLLGEAMALREGKSVVDLLTEKVIHPLGLTDTTATLDDTQKPRFAAPRNTKGQAVMPWTFKAMAAAGCLRSSARDLAVFSRRVIQALNAPKTTLDRAICRSTQPIIGLGPGRRLEPMAQCAGWMSIKLKKTAPHFLYHDGGTAGSTCALYICPKKDAALAILSNNGVVANLYASTKLSWSNQLRQAHDHFETLPANQKLR